jgi:hypothetical protein
MDGGGRGVAESGRGLGIIFVRSAPVSAYLSDFYFGAHHFNIFFFYFRIYVYLNGLNCTGLSFFLLIITVAPSHGYKLAGVTPSRMYTSPIPGTT